MQIIKTISSILSIYSEFLFDSTFYFIFIRLLRLIGIGKSSEHIIYYTFFCQSRRISAIEHEGGRPINFRSMGFFYAFQQIESNFYYGMPFICVFCLFFLNILRSKMRPQKLCYVLSSRSDESWFVFVFLVFTGSVNENITVYVWIECISNKADHYHLRDRTHKDLT